ncbi:MAG: DEAD/DEAH box helicase [Planctomycetes bacterium]|nr:DEAD/DEAH box helicase [Planctomycetota bacterium]
MIQFENLGLCEPILRALLAENYAQPTPIQARSIPELLAGRDLLGCAQTGTGKTAAFALPILQRFSASKVRPKPREPRALVLVPTRELALQVKQSFVTYGRFLSITATVVYGGVGKGPQATALARGVDVVVATPGRLLDLMNDRAVKLSGLEVFVLDEADQMLDLGFERDVERILKHLPSKRQTIFFSATMPPPIAKLANGLLKDPARVVVTPVASTVDTVEQVVQYVETADKPDRLADVLRRPEVERALIFVRTKHGANRVAKRLVQQGLRADAIHGNKSQGQRERTLESFRAARTPFLVATDIAARGIDVDGITHVVNFDLPNVPEVYVHRIGRTARAGATGVAISFCSRSERPFLKDIERLIRRPLHVDTPARFAKRGPHVETPQAADADFAAELSEPALAASAPTERRERAPQHERGGQHERRDDRGRQGGRSHERGERRDSRPAHAGRSDARPQHARAERAGSGSTGAHGGHGRAVGHGTRPEAGARRSFEHRAAHVEDHPPRESFGLGVEDRASAHEGDRAPAHHADRGPAQRTDRPSHGEREPRGGERAHTERAPIERPAGHTGPRPSGPNRSHPGQGQRSGGKRFNRARR